MDKLQLAVLQTLAYADIFDYPLKFAELHRFLIADKSLSKANLKKALSQMNTDLKLLPAGKAGIDADGKYYFLKDRGKIVGLRKKRQRWTREKLKIAQRVTDWLKLIPWVKLVGVTGGLAILNSNQADDIDILIVSSQGRLWLTRLASVLILEALGKRRRPNDREVRDKICLNMFLDEAHLAVPTKERDLFTAHEVSQLKILWAKEGIEKKFLWENRWVSRYLPNAIHVTHNTKHITPQKVFSFQFSVFSFFERLAKNFQLWYMRKRRTTEVISEGIIRFHPQDAREWVLKTYHLRLQKLGLDKSEITY